MRAATAFLLHGVVGAEVDEEGEIGGEKAAEEEENEEEEEAEASADEGEEETPSQGSLP
jgi:hypothetical protein